MGTERKLTVQSSEIVAHLFYSACVSQQVVVTSAAGERIGELLEPTAAEIGIAMSEPPLLRPGAPVCVAYAGAVDAYRFYTEVSAVTADGIRVALPYAVEHADRRLVPRHVIEPTEGFSCRPAWEDAPAFALHDLSAAGMSFRDPQDYNLRIGSFLEVEIGLPGESPFPAELEVRWMQLRRGALLVGTRIAEISLRNRARLAWALVHRAERVAA